jgi:hypothetical protein
MPYIKADDGRREALKQGDIARLAGELNFQMFYYIRYNFNYNVSMDLGNKLRTCVQQFLGEKPNYQKYNDMTGALYRCYKEVERRLGYKEQNLIDILESYEDEINKYEDLKISENGDVE